MKGWKFPLSQNEVYRIQIAFISLVIFLMFLGASIYYNDVLYPLLLVGIFLVLYVFSARILRSLRFAEEHYFLYPTHLEIHRFRGDAERLIKIPWRSIRRHKLDRFWLGGYLITSSKEKHPLFFNTEKEMDKFEKVLLKKM